MGFKCKIDGILCTDWCNCSHATLYFNTSLLLRQNIWNYLSTPDSKNLGPTWVCIFRLRIFGAAKKRGKLQRWESNRVSTLRLFILCVWERSLSKSFLKHWLSCESIWNRKVRLSTSFSHSLLASFFFFFLSFNLLWVLAPLNK